jgi:hypothetical protein
MITVDQLTLLNLVPRGKSGTCVLAAICFVTGTNYFDVEELIQREQPTFRPDLKAGRGVYANKLFGHSRHLFGHTFTKLTDPVLTLDDFLRRHPTGTYLVCRKRHAFVIKDGKVFDWFSNTDRYDILFGWEVKKD